jgi:hypothetical protein
MNLIKIVQCLCPQRHCILALAFDGREHSDEAAVKTLRDTIQELTVRKTINPWCHLCRSRELHYEVGITQFKTMEEALPELQRLAEEQAFARLMLSQN